MIQEPVPSLELLLELPGKIAVGLYVSASQVTRCEPLLFLLKPSWDPFRFAALGDLSMRLRQCKEASKQFLQIVSDLKRVCCAFLHEQAEPSCKLPQCEMLNYTLDVAQGLAFL